MSVLTPEREQAPVKSSKTQFWFWRILTASLILFGVGALLYPTASQWMTQKVESAAVETLLDTVSVTPEEVVSQKLIDARQYNEALASGYNMEDYDYLSAVSIYPDQALARLRIPSINLDQSVHHTMNESVLQKGLGHMEGTSLPVGGTSTNAVIGGHRGLATAVGLTYLNKVGIGDDIYIQALGQNLRYQVISTEILSPGDADMQPVIQGRDLVTLVTCTPLGLNTDRIVVVAERVLPDLDDTALPSASDVPGFPWWAVIFGSVLVLSTSYVLYPKVANKRKA